MTIYEAILNRHAVRNYQKKELESKTVNELKSEIDDCNKESGLSIQMILNDESVFKGLMAHYGGFRNVTNYIAIVGSSDQEEKAGYFGERIVLKAQQLGLNTCWVAVSYKKKKCKAVINDNQELICVITVGYGATQGVPHKSKPTEELYKCESKPTESFMKGIECAKLAPTALNKQDFVIVSDGDNIKFEVSKSNFTELNTGIIKYHFEVGSSLIKED